jgi:beta-lactamase regulating signal transducer with metallopeptidase domain/murein DD-endopeptidase MepM/ murein hydrolase activator NlpD
MIETLSLQTSLLQTLGWTLIHSLWQGVLIAALLFFVLLFVKRSQVRYGVSCAALLLMVLIPVVTFGMLTDKPTLSVKTDVGVDVTSTNESSNVDEGVNVGTLQTPPREGQRQGIAPTGTWTDERFWRIWLLQQGLTDYLPYLVVLWLLGVVVLSLRLLMQWFYAERFKRRHTNHASSDLQQLVRVLALRLCVSRPVQLLESSLVDAPMVIGFLKPVILLPTSALTGLTMQQLESLLAHELAHIRRHDYLVNILQSVAETLLFYHPAVWWVSHRIRIEREHCCDDVAVNISGNAVVYARALATLETLRSQPQLALAASDGKLVSRIKRILGKPERSSSWLAYILIMAVLITPVLFLNAREVDAQTTQPLPEQIWTTVLGRVDFSDDFSKITYIDPNSYILIEQREGDNRKQIKVVQPSEGQQVFTYMENSEEKAMDDSAKTLYELGYTFIAQNYQDQSGKLTSGTWHYDKSTNTFYSFSHAYSANESLFSILDMSVVDEKGNVLFDSLTDDPKFSLYDHIARATHYAAHNLLNSKDSIHDMRIQTFVNEILESIPLTPRDLQALFLLIEEMRTEKYKKEVLLKYLDKVTSLNETELEQTVQDELSKIFTLPFDNAEVTAHFGELGNSISLRAPSTDTSIKAMQDGKVLNASLLSLNDGYLVLIEHANGFITAYANLQSKDLPEQGQAVKQGDVIGYLGGGYMWPKDILKLYVRDDTRQFVDPLQFLPELPTKLESTRLKIEKTSVDPAVENLETRVGGIEKDFFHYKKRLICLKKKLGQLLQTNTLEKSLSGLTQKV